MVNSLTTKPRIFVRPPSHLYSFRNVHTVQGGYKNPEVKLRNAHCSKGLCIKTRHKNSVVTILKSLTVSMLATYICLQNAHCPSSILKYQFFKIIIDNLTILMLAMSRVDRGTAELSTW